MKNFKRILVFSLFLVPVLLLTACGAMSLKGKTFGYESSTVNFSGSGTANQTELENAKQNLKGGFENIIIKFNDDGSVAWGDETLYYAQDDMKIKLFKDQLKTTVYDGFGGSDVTIAIQKDKIKISYKGDLLHDNSQYQYSVTLKQVSDNKETNN